MKGISKEYQAARPPFLLFHFLHMKNLSLIKNVFFFNEIQEALQRFVIFAFVSRYESLK